MTLTKVVSNDNVPALVERICKIVEAKKLAHKLARVLISVAGVPGSGKSTLAKQVVLLLNDKINGVILPQDGYHRYRWELARFADANEAVRRRGAPFTFNVEKFLTLIKKLKDPQFCGQVLKAPSFDHKLKDPVEEDIVILPEVEVVIIEGNYVSLKDQYWDEISKYVDETWFISADLEVVKKRLVQRHLEAGIAQSVEEAEERAFGSDLDNAKYILAHSKSCDVLITS